MAAMDRFLILGLLGAFCVIAASDKAPVLIWSNDESQALPSALVGHTLNQEDFKKNYIDRTIQNADHNTIVFLQDKLSLDDITKHANVYSSNSDGASFQHLKEMMETHHSTHLPSVSSPSELLESLREKFEGLVHNVPDTVDSLADVPLDRTKRNLVMVKLPKFSQGSISKIDGILGKMTSEVKSLGKPFTAMYTGHSTSKVSGDHLYLGRHLLAEPSDSNFTFINFTANGKDCVYLYYTNVQFASDNATVNLPHNPATVTGESSCSNGSAVLTLKYADTAEVTGVTFKFTFMEDRSMWNVSSFAVSYTTNKQSAQMTEMDPRFVTLTPMGFSYHCYPGEPIREKTGNMTSTKGASIRFTSLQVQALEFKKHEFGYPNDCVGFFTISIWMGIIVAFLLISILTFGIMMLANISTMDRFDDPKGKTITVNVMDG